MTDEQREYEHTQRMKRICRRVIAVSERMFADTGKHRHDYEVAKSMLADLTSQTSEKECEQS